MGHSSVRTLRRYAKNTYEHHQKAVENLERMLAPLMAPKAEQSDESETKLGMNPLPDSLPSPKTEEI
jgi:hypothetical protein